MKLHLPLPLRTALLSALLPVVGFSSVAYGEKLCGNQSDEFIINSEGFIGYDSFVVCHRTSGISTIKMSDIDYLYVYNNEGTSAIHGNNVISMFDCDRVVFKNNESSEDYTYDITGVSALAGGGAITGLCKFYSIGDLIFSGNRATQGVGGAIDSDGDPVYIQSCGNVTFKDNCAKKGGGAIGLFGNGKGWVGSHEHFLHLSYNTKAVTFSNNRAGEDGGAISARYAKIEWNKGKVEFVGNIADGYGGAIYLSDYNGYDYSPWMALSLYNNGEVVFRENYGGIKGGAIYASSSRGGIYITNNKRAIFENNIGGAICANYSVYIQGNDEVLFRGNRIAIDAGSVNLSTTANEYSNIDVYDVINAKWLYLNTLTPKYGESGGTANGIVRFSGELSDNTVSGYITIGAGRTAIEKGAKLRARGYVAHKGGELIIGQHAVSETVLGVGTDYSFTSGGNGVLTFDLDYDGASVEPMVRVGGNLSLIGDCLQIDDSGLSGNAATIALLSVGNKISYNGKTYTYDGGDWVYTSNKVSYTLPMDEIVVNEQLHNGASLKWVDKTLYYTIADTGVWERHVKGLGKDRTWRGDVLDWYDNRKTRELIWVNGYAWFDRDDKLCWAAAASNVIAYWQDKYAPLYQDDKLCANKQSLHKCSQEIFDQFRYHMKNVPQDPSVALKWWFSDNYRDISAFLKRNENNWGVFNFNGSNFVEKSLLSVTSQDDLDRVLQSGFNESESALIIGFHWYAKGTSKTSILNGSDSLAGHAITCWKIEKAGNDYKIYYTDSDNAINYSKLDCMTVRFLDDMPVIVDYDWYRDGASTHVQMTGNDYNIFNSQSFACLTSLDYLTTPVGMDELLESYNNTKTLHWTGTAEGSRWKASSHTIGGMRHLADSTDGWKKECQGGGKTIYAHAYFTKDNAQQMDFIFDSQVGTSGTSVSNRVVRIEDDIKVNNVSVKSEYHFAGNGTLNANQLEVEGFLTIGDFNGIFGTDAELLSGNVKISNTPIVIGGTLKLDNFERKGATLTDGCAVTLEGGTLWCGGIKLVRATELGDVTIGRYDYNAAEANMQMQACTVTGSGTFGCVIDMDGNVLDYANWALGSTAELNERFFYYIVSNNTSVAGDAGDYHFEYELTNAAIESNVDTIKEVPLRLSAASLSISASAGWLTIGSAGVMNAESAADITICETNGATVNAGETVLMTVPAEEVYLTQETSITTPELTVAEESSLTNEGRISGKVLVEAFATLGGSGNFGVTTVYEGGRVMVGSSPGAPVYEGLTMHSGSELIFCLDGSTPARADKQGWGSGTHSVLTVTQAGGLVVENGTTVSVGCSLDFLNASPLGETQTLSLVQLSSAGSAELLNALQSGTQFMLAEADDSLSALIDVGAHVHDVQWAQGVNNTLQLSFIVSSCPQDALIWTNGSGDGIWNDSSQNWETLSGTASLFTADSNVAFYKGGTVVLNEQVTVGDVVVSTAENLRWEGNGGIAGSGTLTKEGPGALTLATDNRDFAGRVEINGGHLTAAAAASLGSGTVVLNGGVLEIAASGVGNAIMNVGDSTLSVSSGLTHQLKQSIYNTGNLALVGRFDVSGLEAEATGQNMRVDALGKVSKDGEGSGFLRTGDLSVTVAGNLGDPHTVDASGAVVLYKGQAVTMDNGVGIIAGQLHYDQYLLTGNDSATVSGIVAQAGNQLQEIRMTGGSLTVNQDCDVLNATAGTVLLKSSRLGGTMSGSTAVEVSGVSVIAGNNSHSGGTILRDGAVLSVGHAHALGNGSISNEGKGTISVNTGVSLALVQSISNSGTLSLSGVLDAGKLKLDVDAVGYITLTGDKVEHGTGFVDAGSYSVRIVDGGKTVNEGVSILHDDYRMRSELVLGEDGVARAGGGVDYSRFFLTGADAVSVSEVDAVSELKGSDLLSVTMDGGELEVDADITVEASGGNIVITDDSTLRGAIAHADITAAVGDYTSDISADVSGGSKVTVTGGEVTLSGANSYTGGTVISGGSLTAGSDTAFGTGEVELRGGELELNRKPLENKLLAQGGIISGGSGFRGTVVFNGAVGMRGNLSARSMTINSGSVLTLNGSIISVSGSLTLGGSAVLNLNGSDFGDGDVLITFGSLSGSEDLLTVTNGADSDKYGVEKKGNALILAWLEETQPEPPEVDVPTLDRESCDALLQSSWGVFTASHAFADAIGGQRSAAGYVGRQESVVWVSALGGMHRIDGSVSSSGSDIDLFGAAAGMEYYMSATDTVGIAVGHLSGDVRLKNSGRETEQSGTYFGLYGVHQLADFDRSNHLNLRWSAVYGDTETEGSIGQEKMSLSQDSVQLNARVDWASQLNDAWAVNVFAGMEYFASESAENAESDKARVRMGSIQNLRGELGIGTRYTSGSTSLYGEVRYLNDMVRSNPYADINGVRGYGANPGRQGIGVTLGAQQELGNGWSVHASYSLEAMSEATMHSANIGAALRF